MVFILDNYDSFTYNLAQYLGELGETVEVRRNDQVTLADIERLRPARVSRARLRGNCWRRFFTRVARSRPLPRGSAEVLA